MAYSPRYLPGQNEIRGELQNVAIDTEERTSLDVDPVVHIEERIDAGLNQSLRLTPPPTGQRLTLPPPQRGSFGDKVVVSLESPEGELIVTALPYQDGGRGEIIRNTVNGTERVSYSATGLITFESNGDTKWSSTTQLSQSSAAARAAADGAAGATGEKGDKGDRGEKGDPGRRGDPGRMGFPGQPGINATRARVQWDDTVSGLKNPYLLPVGFQSGDSLVWVLTGDVTLQRLRLSNNTVPEDGFWLDLNLRDQSGGSAPGWKITIIDDAVNTDGVFRTPGQVQGTTPGPSYIMQSEEEGCNLIIRQGDWRITGGTAAQAVTGFVDIAAGNGGTRASTSAEPIVTFSASANMSAERVLTSGLNTTVNVGTVGQIKIDVADTVGRDGMPGRPGQDGRAGFPGRDGAPGQTGATGLPGATIAGRAGDDGRRGFPGERGANGVDGVIGRDGAAGFRGRDGDRGMSGFPGATGLTGSTGATGDTGGVGAAGPAGFRGRDGNRGMMGFPGGPGATGSSGATGDTGQTGQIGSPGYRGRDGDRGALGFPGARGTDGAAGTNGANGTNGAPGAPGFRGRDGDRGAFGFPGANGLNGTNGSNGLPGSTGVAGSPGFRGRDGDIGRFGFPGIAGVPGATGATGTVGPLTEQTDAVAGARDNVVITADTLRFTSASLQTLSGFSAIGTKPLYITAAGGPLTILHSSGLSTIPILCPGSTAVSMPNGRGGALLIPDVGGSFYRVSALSPGAQLPVYTDAAAVSLTSSGSSVSLTANNGITETAGTLYQMTAGSGAILTTTGGALQLTPATVVDVTGSPFVRVRESGASTPAVGSGSGMYWTKNTAPSSAAFTDDTEVDKAIVCAETTAIGDTLVNDGNIWRSYGDSHITTASATVVSNSTVQTAILNLTIPANTLVVGAAYELYCCGSVDRSATAGVAVNVTLTILIGVSPIAVATRTMPATVSQSHRFILNSLFKCSAIGAGGSLNVGFSLLDEITLLGTTTPLVNRATQARDTTASILLSLQVNFAAAVAGTSVVVYDGHIRRVS